MTAATFEDFCTAVLAPWRDDAGTQQGDRTSFAKASEAAAFALWQASTQLKGKKGIVEILAATEALKRECRQFIEAYVEQKLLAKLVRKTTPDAIEIGSVSVEITTNDKRRGRDVLVGILLRKDATTVAVEMDPIERGRLTMFVIAEYVRGDRSNYDIALEVARVMDPVDPQGWLDCQEEEHHRAVRDAPPMNSRWMRTSAQDAAIPQARNYTTSSVTPGGRT